MKLPIRYGWYVDIVFHVLTHMKIDNASNLFSEGYVDEIARERLLIGFNEDLLVKVQRISAYYSKRFERLAVINFLPFIGSDFEEVKQILLDYPFFNENDKTMFIEPFVGILNEEETFYREYWMRRDSALYHKKILVESMLKEELERFKCLFNFYKKYYNKTAEVFLAYSIRGNGRGVGQQDSFLTAVPFPMHEEDYKDCFFMVLHEFTHPCTDKIVGNIISMGDGTHSLTENVVIWADYYLINSIHPALVEAYLNWICRKSEIPNEKFDEKILKKVFCIPRELDIKLKALISKIIEHSNSN